MAGHPSGDRTEPGRAFADTKFRALNPGLGNSLIISVQGFPVRGESRGFIRVGEAACQGGWGWLLAE